MSVCNHEFDDGDDECIFCGMVVAPDEFLAPESNALPEASPEAIWNQMWDELLE